MPKNFTEGHALIIGVGDDNDLPGTINDAKGLADILKNEGRCAYLPEQVHLLTNEQANRDSVLTSLDKLAQSTDSNSTVIIYFSGHGYTTGKSHYLMTYGYDVNRLEKTAISGTEFADKLKAIEAKKVVVLLDCCHAGGVSFVKGVGLTKSPIPIPHDALEELEKGKGYAFIASSRENEFSYLYPGDKYSLFTQALIEVLQGQGVTRNEAGYVRVLDLARYTCEVVPKRTKDKDQQHPIFDFKQADNFAIAYHTGGSTQPNNLPLGLESPEGQVPLNSPFYVTRPPIEPDCYDAILKPDALIRIKAPRQMGKTSLMTRILHHAKQHGASTVSLSFQQADNKVFADIDQFLRWFCLSITRKLNLPVDKVTSHWMDFLGAKDNCTDYFQNNLLAETSSLTLGLDEVDQIFKHPEIAADFFGLLRFWHEEGKNEEIWKKLRLVIVHSKEVYVPLNIHQSPFNVGLAIELPEFTQAQVQDLVQRHELNWTIAQVEQLMTMIGGLPYLIRVALYQIANERMTLEQLLKIAPTEEGLYYEHLHRHLLNLEQAGDDLVAAMKQVVTDNHPVEIDPNNTFKLRSMGLVKSKGHAVIPRCDLYRRYFGARL